MSGEQGAIAPGEYLLRRIHSRFYKADLEIPVTPEAFRPNENDVDGLSVFRASMVTPIEVANRGKEGIRYWIARVSVEQLQELGLSVEPDPAPDAPPGHAHIPELSYSNYYMANKNERREILLALARLAGEQIAYCPDSS